LNERQKQLLLEAEKATRLAYAPYSKFRVGAALYADGQIYHGANVENACSNLGICAERVALAHAKMHSVQQIEGIAICCIDAPKDAQGYALINQAMPCGGCLQWLSEIAPHAWIVTNASERVYALSELLPIAFSLPDSKGQG
jgi:cytidine deaminase